MSNSNPSKSKSEVDLESLPGSPSNSVYSNPVFSSTSNDKNTDANQLTEAEDMPAQKRSIKDLQANLKKLEQDFTRLKSEIYQSKHKELTESLLSIQSGKSQQLIKSIAYAKQVRKEKLKMAKRNLLYLQWEARVKLNSDNFETNNQFYNEKLEVKRKLRNKWLQIDWLVKSEKVKRSSAIEEELMDDSNFVLAEPKFSFKDLKPKHISDTLILEDLAAMNPKLRIDSPQPNSHLKDNYLPHSILSVQHDTNLDEIVEGDLSSNLRMKYGFDVGDQVKVDDRKKVFLAKIVGHTVDEVILELQDSSNLHVERKYLASGKIFITKMSV